MAQYLKKIEHNKIPWSNCISLGGTHVLKKNSACYFMGCACHIVHNIARHASEACSEISGLT